MWYCVEISYMSFGDKRIAKRAGELLKVLYEKPKSSIPEACKNIAQTKAAYRFFANDKVNVEKIIKGTRKATVDRMKDQKLILFPSDATNLVFSSHKKLKGIGVLRSQRARGLNLHTTLAITPDGLNLGLIDQKCWGRAPEDYGKRKERKKLPITERESYRWFEALQAVEESLPDHCQGIMLGDRGADIYELFLAERKTNVDLLIRASHNRELKNDSELFSEVEEMPVAGIMTVTIPRSGNRPERVAKLEIRYKEICIKAPKHKKHLPDVIVNAVFAKEIYTESSAPIIWRLLTTISINSLDDAINIVAYYSKRWIIERFHYTLKQGCQIEELELEDAERMKPAVAMYSIVAWRLMYLTYINRSSPDLSCSTIFSELEWKALFCYAKKSSTPPIDPPTMREAVRAIAMIGGFLGRKGDGEPGLKVIWRGLRTLEGIIETYRILKCG